MRLKKVTAIFTSDVIRCFPTGFFGEEDAPLNCYDYRIKKGGRK